MKKKLLVVCVIVVLAASSAFAARTTGFAIGGEGSLYFVGSGGLPTSAMLLLHLPSFPLMLGIGVTTTLDLGITADYWFSHGNLASVLSYYVGLGGYLSLSFNGSYVAAGARLPIGLQLWPFGQVFEIFIEVAPAVGFVIIPTAFDWHLQGALGFRFWL
jgi:hypothetical protein